MALAFQKKKGWKAEGDRYCSCYGRSVCGRTETDPPWRTSKGCKRCKGVRSELM